MRVAIPYYGQLLRPGLGLERVYFNVELSCSSGTPGSWSLQVWDPLKKGLCGWLEEQGITGLACRDSCTQLIPELKARGIETLWGENDDFESIVAQCQFEVG